MVINKTEHSFKTWAALPISCPLPSRDEEIPTWQHADTWGYRWGDDARSIACKAITAHIYIKFVSDVDLAPSILHKSRREISKKEADGQEDRQPDRIRK